MLTYSATDVNRKLAHDAHRGTSFSPERRADGYVQTYLEEMRRLAQEFEQYATTENRAEIAAALERYRQGYLKRMHAYLAAHSRCLSPMITGPANFPTRRNEKANRTADKRRDEWLDYCKRIPEKLRQAYDPARLAAAPISADDDEAPAKLAAKIERLAKNQEMMKAANRVIRKKAATAEQKVTGLQEIGFSQSQAGKLLTPDFAGRLGFPPYALQNNNANIRRLKQRLAGIEAERQRAAAAPVADTTINGAIIRENTELNRLQIIFDGKPPAELRAKLKSRGFRWAPSQGAWQRQLTPAARQAARFILNS